MFPIYLRWRLFVSQYAYGMLHVVRTANPSSQSREQNIVYRWERKLDAHNTEYCQCCHTEAATAEVPINGGRVPLPYVSHETVRLSALRMLIVAEIGFNYDYYIVALGTLCGSSDGTTAWLKWALTLSECSVD